MLKRIRIEDWILKSASNQELFGAMDGENLIKTNRLRNILRGVTNLSFRSKKNCRSKYIVVYIF
jgi:hypothetical protein